MQIRCYRCGWSFAVKDDELSFVLEALEQEGGSHYDVRCPRCRRTTKLSLEQLQQAVPRPGSDGSGQSEAAPVQGEGGEDNAEPEAGDE